MYAGDTQLYIEFDLRALPAETAKMKIESCVTYISVRMCQNKLKLKEDKTELLVITPSRQADKVNIESVKVGNCDINPSHAAHTLGAIFDDHMTMQPHVS